MEESNVAAAPATEAPKETNTTTQDQPQQAQITPDAVAGFLGTDVETLEKFTKFTNANGSFEKAFAKLRNDVSTPAPEAPAQPKAEEPKTAPQQLEQVANNQSAQQSVPMGYITPEEFTAQQYFASLANEPEFANISDQVKSGAVLKEMAKFGIRPMQNGAINDRQIRDFLGLYAKTVPTQAPTAPVTNTPTVEYVNVGDQITSRDDAMKILEQNRTLKPGIAPHPQTEAAKEFLKGYFNGTKK